MVKFIIKVLILISISLVLVSCRGIQLPSYYTGESSIYGGMATIHVNQSQESVFQQLGKPTKKYFDWPDSAIKSNMKDAFKNTKPFSLSSEDKYDLWYYYAQKHETYNDTQTTTSVTIPKFCYLAFSLNKSQLAWFQCYTAPDKGK